MNCAAFRGLLQISYSTHTVVVFFGCELCHLNNININTFCTVLRTGLRRIWNLPNTTHSDLLHLLSDDLPIFDELCRRYLMFIYKYFFHSSNLVRLATRHGVMFARHKSLPGSNFSSVFPAISTICRHFLTAVLMLIT